MRKKGRGKERDTTTDLIDFHVFTYVSRVTKFRIRYLPRNAKNPDVWTTKQDYADVEDSTLPVLQKLMVSLVWIKTVQRADISPLNV